MSLVTGWSLVPCPPAKTIPLIGEMLVDGLVCIFGFEVFG